MVCSMLVHYVNMVLSFVLKALHLPKKNNLLQFLFNAYPYLLKSRSYLKKNSSLWNIAALEFVVDSVAVHFLPSFYIEVTLHR